MAIVLSTDKSDTKRSLIDSIKRRASIPSNQSTYTDEDILAFANEEMALTMIPQIMGLHEDYFLFRELQPLEANEDIYPIPERAIGNKLRELQYIDSNGNHFEMTRISVGDIPDYQGIFTQNHAYTFYVENNNIRLLPPAQSSASGSLLFFYYIRPNELVQFSRIGVITNINTSTGEISISTAPSHFSTNIQYDFYKADSPHSNLAIDLTATAWNSTTKTLTFTTTDIPDELQVGDHVAQKCECALPQIPADLHVLLAQYVAERILEAQGDTQGLSNAKTKTREMELRAGNIIDNRIDDAPQKLVNRNGLLRFGLHSKRYRRRN